MQCPQCRHGNLTGQKFCGECGARLAVAAPAAPSRSDRFDSPASYTPKHLAEKILTSKAAIEGERKLVTVMFADVSGFTALGNALDPEELVAKARGIRAMEGADLVKDVTCAVAYDFKPTLADTVAEATFGVLPQRRAKRQLRVAAYDFGIKLNILRRLAAHGCDVRVFPASAPASDLLAWEPDGIFLSNGPGDPAAVTYAIQNVRSLVEIAERPIFGICLGHQLLGLSLGAETYKLKFGHRGANHPVKQLDNGKIEITSQNHGFAVDPDSLPAHARVTHLNLYDGTVEGLRHVDKPIYSVQYHPEASPGPHDADYLFQQFIEEMEKR
jgi:carbamoyl-phosphate synthase small subunit